MNTRGLEEALLAADPVDPGRLERLDLAAMEADLLADMESGSAPSPAFAPSGPRPLRRRPLTLGLGAAALAAVVVLVIVVSGGGSGGSSRAYGAELVRFAESTPLLLLEGPGWRVQNVSESETREGTVGSMEFVTGKPVSLEGIRPIPTKSGENLVKGLPPASARRRLVQLRWRTESLGVTMSPAAGGGHHVKLPVLGTTALVDTRAERFANQGRPGDREMLATWTEDGNVVELQASVPDLAGMAERLGWLTKVDSQTWLEAMPAKVVKAANFERTVKEMVKGIPLPKTFTISRVPDEGLTTSRKQVASKVSTTVSCLWLRQWGDARRSGDEAAELEAEKAMATSRAWPMFHAEKGDEPYTAREIEEVAQAMSRGYWIYRGHPQNLLAHAEKPRLRPPGPAAAAGKDEAPA